MIVYAGLSALTGSSIAQSQYMLGAFSGTIIGLLSTAIMLIAPALTAGSVAGERQRKSLDLVLSTPIEYKHYLVGKLIASYRYTWMLLLLSLPLVSMCVVVGGATWVDVITSFIYLSLYGLLFTAIGLLCSVLAPRPVSAVVYSYITVIAYTFLMSTLASALGYYGSPYSGATSPAYDIVSSLSPVMTSFRADLSTSIIGVNVPNWVLVALFVILVCKLLLLGAASALSRYGSPETKSLRIHCLVYIAIIAALVAAYGAPAIAASTGSFSGTTVSASFDSTVAAYFLCLLALCIHWLIPFIACYSPLAERKFVDPGAFSIKSVLSGEPSGALPYLLLIVLVATVTLVAIPIIGSNPVDGLIVGSGAMWAAGFLIFVWSMARLTSSADRALTAARGAAMLLITSVMLLPLPLLAVLSAGGNSDYDYLHPMAGAFGQDGNMGSSGLVLAIIGAIIGMGAQWNDSRLRRRQVIET